MSDDYYDLLGVDPGASRDQLRDAYRSRVDELTAAREKKGVTEGQLQDNRAEVARVRAAWNVLSDPFQRQRYDAQATAEPGTGPRDGDGGDVEIVDDGGSEVALTGWRKLMAPPPKQSSGAAGGSKEPPARPVRQPTIPMPPGMHIAQSKTRGMALLFDLAVVLVLLYAVNLVVPNLIQSDYSDKAAQITNLRDAGSAQDDIKSAKDDIADADKSISQAEDGGTSAELKSAQLDKKNAQSDLDDAQKDFNDAQKDFNDKQKSQGLGSVALPHDTDKLEDMSSQLSDDIRPAQLASAAVVLLLALLYLVPVTVRTGSSFGMRGRKIKVVMVDGSPARTWPVVARFAVPLLLGLAGSVTPVPIVASLAPIAALGVVLWGYRDPNGQGVHDKLAHTLVVDA